MNIIICQMVGLGPSVQTDDLYSHTKKWLHFYISQGSLKVCNFVCISIESFTALYTTATGSNFWVSITPLSVLLLAFGNLLAWL